MFDFSKALQILVEAASFVSAFAAIAAGLIMAKFLRKFVTGILARGFKTIGIGIFIIAWAIITDTAQMHMQNLNYSPSLSTALLILKQVLFLAGTYTIVIGSKTMGDKLEELSKHTPT